MSLSALFPTNAANGATATVGSITYTYNSASDKWSAVTTQPYNYRTTTNFTATSGQTTFTGLSYTVGYVDVYRNGVRLTSSDYTATSGSTIVLTDAAAAGDSIMVESYKITTVTDSSDMPLAGGTFTGPVTYNSAANATFNGSAVFNRAAVGTPVTLTSASTITPDFSLGNYFNLTLDTNATLANPTNLTAGQSGAIVITQDGTGSRTLAYGGNWKFASGTAPSLTTTAGAVDVLAYYVESATRITARMISDTK
jgi:hypothetical protein